MSPVMEGDRPLANTKSGLWSLLGSAQPRPTAAHLLPLPGTTVFAGDDVDRFAGRTPRRRAS
jgi:hypothetical protein